MPRKSAWEHEVAEDQNVVVHHGATISQLAKMFGMNRETVKGRLSVVQPIQFGKVDRYPLKDAAPHLVKPIGNIEDALRTMNADALPANLRKEYWSAKRQEQAYRKEEGELWDTEDVLGHFAETFKVLRTELLLLSEAVEREMQLPDRAREILKGQIDATMENVRKALVEKFGTPKDPAPPESENWDIRVEPEEEDDEFEGL